MPLVIDKTKDPFYLEGIEKGEKGLILEAQELVIEALDERFGFMGGGVKGQDKINPVKGCAKKTS